MNQTKNRTTRMGLFTLLTAVLLAAVLLAVNLLTASLPTDIKTLDITDTKMFSVSDSTKREIAKGTTPIEIYLVSTNGEKSLADEGMHLHTFLGNLAAVNKNISYAIVNPLKDTDFISRYSFGNEIGNLSVIVESELRAYHVPVSDFFSYYIDQVGKISESDAMYYYYYYGVTPYYCFDGEALMLAAISHVSNTELPAVYTLSGHSEGDLATTAAGMLKTIGVSPVALSLSSGTPVPEDCDLLVISAPQTDITAAEAALLCDYLAKGGAILLTTAPNITSLPNLGTVTAYMALQGVDGIVAETDSQHYYNSSYPHYLAPNIHATDMTEGVSSVLLPVTHGIVPAADLAAGMTVTPLLSTSESAYLIPLDATSPEKPDGAQTASFCVGAVSEISSGGKLVWIPCANFLSDAANEVSAGGNGTLLHAVVTQICGETEAPPSAPVLPLVTQTLTVSTATAGILSFVMIVLLPAGIVGFGIFHVIRRKRR